VQHSASIDRRTHTINMTDTRGPNLERLARDYYDHVDAGRLPELLVLFHDEIVYQRGRDVVIRGKRALARFYRQDRIIASGRHELECVAVTGDWIAVRGRAHGRLRDGADFSVDFADFHRIRAGKIWRRYTYFMDQNV
jgi:ketosteroid isomerase-like protein